MPCDTTHVPARTLDLDELRERLAPIDARDVTRLAGGASSLTFAATVLGGERAVVKVAPPGVPPTLNRDVLRQAMVLRALRGAPVDVPDVIWEDAGSPPDVPPLFVMSFVAGTSFEPLFDDEGHDDEAPVVAERELDAARVLAQLHSVDPASIGLGEEPVVPLDAEIDRWRNLLATVDRAQVPGWEEVAATLEATMPTPARPTVVHGDFRLGNLLAVGGTITTVIDWEIWSVGDPRIDLGWFLANADPTTYRRDTRYSHVLPSPEAVLDVYEDVSSRPSEEIAWFRALACFKSTATWSSIVKHNRRRDEPDANLEAMAAVLPDLLEQARRWLV